MLSSPTPSVCSPTFAEGNLSVLHRLQGGNTVRQLLKIAKKTVPEGDWHRTPVVLKATAGLRLLPEDKANALLKEVRPVSLSALRQFGTNPIGSTKELLDKPLSAYKCH